MTDPSLEASVPTLPPDVGWTTLGRVTADVTSACALRRALGRVGDRTPVDTVPRPLEPDERVALRVLAGWSVDPAALERLGRLDDAAGLGIGGDVEEAAGLRMASRALLLALVEPRGTDPAGGGRGREVLARHAHRDPVLASMLLGRTSRRQGS